MSNATSKNETPIEQWYRVRQQREPQTLPTANTNGPTVAIQGELGSFSHEAALKLVPQASIAPCSISTEVFAALTEGRVDCAVIPIENSLAGSVNEHFDLLLQHDVFVERETLLRIRHNLIAAPGAEIAQIERVFSHPVALAQCKRFLAAHAHMDSYAFYDTAGSVKQLMAIRDRHAAGIGSTEAARCYGAEILAAGIEDNSENYTRFFLVKRKAEAAPAADANKMSLAFAVENRPGSLVAALGEFTGLGANMTKIESRPVHGKPWEYIFYVDCQIAQSSDGERILTSLQKHCEMVKELGRYRDAAS